MSFSYGEMVATTKGGHRRLGRLGSRIAAWLRWLAAKLYTPARPDLVRVHVTDKNLCASVYVKDGDQPAAYIYCARLIDVSGNPDPVVHAYGLQLEESAPTSQYIPTVH